MKLNKKRILVGLTALTVVASLFVGCGKKEEPGAGTATGSTTQTPEATTISVSIWTDEKEEMTEIKQAFEDKNPNVTVEILEFPQAEYKDKLTVQLAGGADIDVILHKNTAEYADIASKGQLLNLDPLVQADKLDVAAYGPSYEGLKIDGELAGMPYRKTAWVLYYNKDLFDAAGVDYPSDDMTWAEFRELAKKMTTDKVAGAYLHTWPVNWYGMGLQNGASLIDQDITSFRDALQYRMDLEADGSIMKYVDAKATNAHYRTEFAKGQTAMNIIGDFHVAQLRELEKTGEVTFDWDIAAMPHLEGVEANTTWGTVNPISINKSTKNQDVAWEFVKFVSGEEGAKIYAKYGNLPGYINDEVEKTFAGEAGQRPANIRIFTEAKVYLENPAIPGIGTIMNEIYGREAELTFAGERSVEDTFKVIQERLQAEMK